MSVFGHDLPVMFSPKPSAKSQVAPETCRPTYERTSAEEFGHDSNRIRPLKAGLSHSRSTSRMTASIGAGQTSLQNGVR